MIKKLIAKKAEFMRHFEKNKESDSEFEELVFVKNDAQSKEFFVSSHTTEILVKTFFQKT